MFESLRNQGKQEASLSLGDVELSVGVRSICETWTPGFTSDSVCAVCFRRTLFFWYQSRLHSCDQYRADNDRGNMRRENNVFV